MTGSVLPRKKKRFLDGLWAQTGKGEQKGPDGGAVQEDPGSIKDVPWYREASTLIRVIAPEGQARNVGMC